MSKRPKPRGCRAGLRYRLAVGDGGAGIRTLETLTGLPVFKTGAKDHSAPPPTTTYGNDEKRLVDLLGAIPPDLMELIQLWPNVPVAVRTSVLGMLRATAGGVSEGL